MTVFAFTSNIKLHKSKSMSTLPEVRTQCLIVGGGPAGMMAGYLMARAGVNVIVLEKHADFFRDFRGDTIHPSTLEVMHELGLLDEFLKLPHQELPRLRGVINGHYVSIADFSRLPTQCKFIGFMPQWDFLNFFAAKAKELPSFALRMQHEVVDLLSKTTALPVRGRKRPKASATFMLISSLAPTGVTRSQTSARDSKFRNSECRSTPFGCIFRNAKAIRSSCSVSFGTASCWF